jgi:hypothetical protein
VIVATLTTAFETVAVDVTTGTVAIQEQAEETKLDHKAASSKKLAMRSEDQTRWNCRLRLASLSFLIISASSNVDGHNISCVGWYNDNG